MWWTVSVARLRCQHLLSRPGSHQQLASCLAQAFDPAPLIDLLVGEGRSRGDVEDRVDRPGVVHLVGGNRRGVGGTRSRVRKHLSFECSAGHARRQNLRDARVLVADRALQVLPARVGRVLRRIERVERDVARATAGSDQERRFDGAVGKPVECCVARLRIVRQPSTIAVPARQAAVDFEPPRLIETRVRKLAIAERSGRSPERQIARRLPLVLRP